MSASQIKVRPERADDLPALQDLAARTFGPGRFARTAHRVREQGRPVEGLSFTAWSGDTLVGAIRFTAIRVGGTAGALLLGPLMVEKDWAGKGGGRALIGEGLKAAKDQGYRLVLLVGDLPYYERFGFMRVPRGQITLPGPVDAARLLAVELEDGALTGFSGQIRAGD